MGAPLLFTSVVHVTPAPPVRFRFWVVSAVFAIASSAVKGSPEEPQQSDPLDTVATVNVPDVSGMASTFEDAGRSFLSSLASSFDSAQALVIVQEGFPSTASVLCVGLVVLVVVYLLMRRAIGGGGMMGGPRSVLFLGPCGAGKTAMVQRLCHHRLVSSVTSMQVGRYDYKANPEAALSAAVVDFPGHERLRGGVAGELSRAERVVFVLDCSSLSAQVPGGAELLYDTLSDPSLESCKGLLLACNKSDLRAVKLSRVKTLLQREIDNLRSTRGTLGTQGIEDQLSGTVALGRPGQPFIFDVDCPCEVTMVTCSVKEDDLGAVRDFVSASVH